MLNSLKCTMEERINISGNAIWEDMYGYSRAVQSGRNVYISGTTATNSNGEIVGEGDPYLQTDQIYKNIAEVLQKVGGTLENVVRVRIYVTDIKHTEKIMQAHKKHFENIRPAATLVQVAALLSEKMLVEIEADVVL